MQRSLEIAIRRAAGVARAPRSAFPIALPGLVGLLVSLVSAGAGWAQPPTNSAASSTGASDDIDKEIAALRGVIEDVEERGWFLIPSRGSYYAMSREQFADDYALKVLQGELHPDSVESRVRRFLAGSRDRLARAKAQLAELESGRRTPQTPSRTSGSTAAGLRRWTGVDGTWHLACGCRYPNCGYPEDMQGEVKNVGVAEQDNGTWGGLTLYRGREYFTSLSGTMNSDGSFAGERRDVQAPIDEVLDIGTVRWSEQWVGSRPPTATQEGALVARGDLTFEGRDASCQGRWSAGWPEPQ